MKPDLCEMVRLAKAADVAERIETTSNVSLLTREKSEQLVKAGLDYLRVSIYGAEKENHRKVTSSPFTPEMIRNNLLTLLEERKKANVPKPFVGAKMLDSFEEENRLFMEYFKDAADELYLDKPHGWIKVENSDFLGEYYGKDLEKAELDRYKTVIFAGTPLLTDEQKEMISRRLKNNKRHLVWCYAPGFSNGKTLDVNFISELTGLAVSETGAENPALAPAFAADEANRTFDDWSSWYFPSGRFETEEIREIFERAGVHIYSKDFEDVIVGNFGTAIHTAHGGKGTVCLRNGEIRNVDLPADSTIIIG